MIPRYRAWFGSEMYDKPVVYDGEFYLDWRDFENGKTCNGAVLMQSTGLFDVNGKEIFEGDVFTCLDDDNNPIYENIVVKFGQHTNMDTVFEREPVYIGFYAEVQKGTATLDVDIMYNDCEGRLTIIGNIYENPELVEEVLND
ncbi:YopX family protein [Streptococcus suis]|uniref:YopX family protein n=1 Tax=Streptococcus suis TaxID=1307 RepID=UPI001583AFBD|nr:YopX family protein [Streptococcus suis]MCK3890735.1 hypothetical protein [Streptococcus suis]HEM6233690.1 hypothetical protein [Streptococcus suis]HEM6335107.1 hypothetical protein [Streptococcus suis]HEM6337559.1 hypothetical protein [Streptococcus suis]HEM6369937.1 hypothetical protein [Streptococcus suis]